MFAQSGQWQESEVNVELLEASVGYGRSRGPARLLLAAPAAVAGEHRQLEGLTTDELCRTARLANSTNRRARAALVAAGEMVAAGEITVDGDRRGREQACRWVPRNGLGAAFCGDLWRSRQGDRRCGRGGCSRPEAERVAQPPRVVTRPCA